MLCTIPLVNFTDRNKKHAWPLFLSPSGGEACNGGTFDDLVSPYGFTCSCECTRRGKNFCQLIGGSLESP